ncbi:hypothetical protein [Synechococcus sp. R55.2]|uniref:hypothetical protein n=1 Tax=Synechococcus sp. R55.2 TaxID=2964496 RepID=UPI0039C1FF8F
MSGLDASAGRGRRSPWAWSGQVKQADSLLDELFEELENSLEEGLSEAGEYPYLGTRPPLLSRRFSAAGGLLLGMALAATLVAGLAFWITLRPRAVVFSQPERDPLAEAPNSSHSDAHQEPLLPTAADVDENPKAPPEDSAKAVLVEPAKPPTVAAPLASRGVGAPSPPRAPAPPLPAWIPPQPVPQMKLVGLIHDPGAPKALILIDNVVRQVAVGHAVKAEWRVTSISPYGVRVSNGAQSVTLQLGLSQRI